MRIQLDRNSDIDFEFKLPSNPDGYQVRIFAYDPFAPEERHFNKNVEVSADFETGSVRFLRTDLEVLNKFGLNPFRVYFVDYANNEEFTVIKGEIEVCS